MPTFGNVKYEMRKRQLRNMLTTNMLTTFVWRIRKLSIAPTCQTVDEYQHLQPWFMRVL